MRALLPFLLLTVMAYGQTEAPQSMRDRANVLLDQGKSQLTQGQFDVAQSDFAAAAVIYQKLFATEPDKALAATDLCKLAVTFREAGNALNEKGNLDQAKEEYRQALTLDQELVDKEPADDRWRLALSINDGEIGLVEQEEDHPAEAMVYLAKELEIQKALVQLHPTDANYTQVLGATYFNRGADDDNNHEAAIDDYELARKIFEKLVEIDPKNPYCLRSLGFCYLEIGRIDDDRGLKDKAKAYLERGLALIDQYLILKPDDKMTRDVKMNFQWVLGGCRID